MLARPEDISVILVHLMATPYCDKAHAACGMCMQLNSYVEFETISLVPFVCSMYFQQQKAGWEQDYSFSTQCESESCLLMITAKKHSPSKFLTVGAYALHM